MKTEMQTKELHIRLSEKDKNKLVTDSKKTGMSASAYLRELIHNRTPKRREDLLQIKELVTEINKIGININQIVAHVNSGFYSEHEKRKLFALMNTLVKHTEDIINGVKQSSEKNKEKEEK